MIQTFTQLDVSIFFLLNNLAGQSLWKDSVFIFFAEYLGYIMVAISLILLYRSKKSLRERYVMFYATAFSSVFARFGLIPLIHFFYHRPRPFLTYHVHQLLQETTYSFPSGHSTFFFTFSFAIFLYNRKWGIWFLLATIVMTTARVISGVHYPSDILGGAIIGISTAYLSFKHIKYSNLVEKIAI